jgi:hypothetical protein
MKAEQIGMIASRALGFGLLVLGLASALWLLPFHRSGVSGWTSYPPTSTSTSEFALHDTYYVVVAPSAWHYFLPSISLTAAGILFIVFGRFFGRLFAWRADREST